MSDKTDELKIDKDIEDTEIDELEDNKDEEINGD